MTFVGVLIIGWGALIACNPYIGWYTQIGWKLRNAQPSDLALAMNRIGGVLLAIVGLFLVFR